MCQLKSRTEFDFKMNFRKILPICGLLFTFSSIFAAPPPNARLNTTSKALFQGPQVYLTVSPVAGYRNEGGETILLDRMLEMHWEGFTNLPDDTIGIYSVDPTGRTAANLREHTLEEHPVAGNWGDLRSSIRYERRSLDPNSERCLGFWVAYIKTQNNVAEIVTWSCLEIYPTWMKDIKSQIKNTPLHSLMIPGTHNAGSWIYYAGLESEGPIIEYTYCHEDNIYDQLIHGIRSFDVRVGHYPLTQEKFYINHGLVIVRPLRTLLEDVKRFVSETNEIVLLDFHQFPVGMESAENHRKLVAFLEEEIGDLLAAKSMSNSVTPEQLWAQNRTVIIFYSNNEIQPEYEFLWPGVRQAWGDVTELEDLERHLESSLSSEGCRGRIWSAMAQCTPTTEDVIIRPSFGIRGYSNITNNEISRWYQRESWYSKAMIVALDHYRSTNVIETSIEVNKNMGNICQ